MFKNFTEFSTLSTAQLLSGSFNCYSDSLTKISETAEMLLVTFRFAYPTRSVKILAQRNRNFNAEVEVIFVNVQVYGVVAWNYKTT